MRSVGTDEKTGAPHSRSRSANANQGIGRFATVLRALGRADRGGARLTDVALETGLSKSTVHRLLSGLVEVGFVEQDRSTGLFHLGFDLFALGTAAANRYSLVELARPGMGRLSSRTDDTITMSVRAGNEAICAHREEGGFPVRVLTLAVGDRRPLGIGSGPLALLAFLPDAEVHTIIEHIAPQLPSYPNYSVSKLYEMVEVTRRQGYALNDGQIHPEIYAVAVPIRGRDGRPIAALSAATIAGRMQAERLSRVVGWLLAEAHGIEARIAALTAGLPEVGLRRFSSPARPAEELSANETP